jgi:hypothetical protein
MKSTQEFLNTIYKSGLVVDGSIGPKSKAAIAVAMADLKNRFASKGLEWWDNAFISLRFGNDYTDNATDWLVYVNGSDMYAMNCTTKPGKYWVYNPVTYGGVTGAACLVGDRQYKDAWTFVNSTNWQTLWLGAPYFYQVGEVEIYRDGNKNDVLELDSTTIQKGLFGINIHRGDITTIIWNWSAGCITIMYNLWVEFLGKGLFTNGQLVSNTILNM